jgi:hypothetical protein
LCVFTLSRNSQRFRSTPCRKADGPRSARRSDYVSHVNNPVKPDEAIMSCEVKCWVCMAGCCRCDVGCWYFVSTCLASLRARCNEAEVAVSVLVPDSGLRTPAAIFLDWTGLGLWDGDGESRDDQRARGQTSHIIPHPPSAMPRKYHALKVPVCQSLRSIMTAIVLPY